MIAGTLIVQKCDTLNISQNQKKIKSSLFSLCLAVFHESYNLLVQIFIHFRIEMEVNSDQVVIIEKMDEEVYSGKESSYHELEVKTEPHDKIENINNEVFEDTSYEPPQIIGEKRKNIKLSASENKKIKEEFVVFEESDYKEEPQEIEEINLGDLNNQVIYA